MRHNSFRTFRQSVGSFRTFRQSVGKILQVFETILKFPSEAAPVISVLAGASIRMGTHALGWADGTVYGVPRLTGTPFRSAQDNNARDPEHLTKPTVRNADGSSTRRDLLNAVTLWFREAPLSEANSSQCDVKSHSAGS
jgi:hypothetical protein